MWNSGLQHVVFFVPMQHDVTLRTKMVCFYNYVEAVIKSDLMILYNIAIIHNCIMMEISFDRSSFPLTKTFKGVRCPLQWEKRLPTI